MQISQRGIDLIESFEGFSAKPYKCPADVWTIGYGTTVINGTPVGPRNPTITEEQAEQYLLRDVRKFENAINDSVNVTLTQNQFDALVSFVYNVGPGNFKSSSLLRQLNAGRPSDAAEQFMRWNKGGGVVLSGLTRRRKAERELFLE